MPLRRRISNNLSDVPHTHFCGSAISMFGDCVVWIRVHFADSLGHSVVRARTVGYLAIRASAGRVQKSRPRTAPEVIPRYSCQTLGDVGRFQRSLLEDSWVLRSLRMARHGAWSRNRLGTHSCGRKSYEQAFLSNYRGDADIFGACGAFFKELGSDTYRTQGSEAWPVDS